jgi:hypothetical protein
MTSIQAFRLALVSISLSIAFVSNTSAAITQITADSSDFFLSPDGGVLNSTGSFLVVGDDSQDVPRISFIKFDISSLDEASISTATLRMSVTSSLQSGDPSTSPPFGNPGLGDVVVYQIEDYGTPSLAALSLPDGDNSPGVIIPGNVNPNQAVSVDALAAVQEAIQNGDDFVAFRIETGVTEDENADNFSFASADNSATALRPVLELSTSETEPPVVTLPPSSIPPTGVPGATLIDRTIDPTTPIELLVTIKNPGGAPVFIWKCSSKDPRWDEVEQEWDIRDAPITQFIIESNCPGVPGFADMDNVVPYYLQANINDDGQAWVGFVFVDSSIDFADVVAGQAIWENVDARIRVDDCGVAAGDRDVDAWGSLTAGPFLEERFLETEYLEVATAQCNRSRLLSRRGSLWSGPWDGKLDPLELARFQLQRSIQINNSPESQACVPANIRNKISAKQNAARANLYRNFNYEKFVTRMEQADKIAADNSGAYAGCSANVLGALRSQLTRAAFTVFDRILHPAPEGEENGYIKYPAPGHTFPEEVVVIPPVID